MKLVRYADRPDLRARRVAELSKTTFPEYMHHNEPGRRFWDAIYVRFPAHQVVLVEGDTLLAEAHAVPLPWDGSSADLPSGWDDGFVRAMTSDRAATALMALAISVSPEQERRGLAARMIEVFRETARGAGLTSVLAPVRPTLKERYPLIAIERYAAWRRADGTHFDPWLRVHERVGGQILAVAPESMTIEAPFGDWEDWTGLALPEDGTHLLPGGLAPLEVRDGIGRHVEPNVWVLHDV